MKDLLPYSMADETGGRSSLSSVVSVNGDSERIA
jgi:hypothetical protein